MNFSTDKFNRTDLAPAIRQALEITDTYIQHQDRHPALREAECLKVQTPYYLTPLRETDLFAGGGNPDRLLYVGTFWWAILPGKAGFGKQGGYCFDFDDTKFVRTPEDREALDALTKFWAEESTPAKIDHAFSEEEQKFLWGPAPLGSGRGGGFVIAPNMDLLLQTGLPGLSARIDQRLQNLTSASDPDSHAFLTGLQTAIQLLIETCTRYESEALGMMSKTADPDTKLRMSNIAEALRNLRQRPPQTLFEAIQLWWIYNIMACGKLIEGWRMDEAFGDFYKADIESKRIDHETAIQLVMGLWRKWDEFGERKVCRGIIGGKGRRNADAADMFALAAMEATRRLRTVIPQLTLRFHAGQNPALLEKAYQVIGEGCTYPMLYNDDVNVPGVMKALNTTEHEAEDYYPLGCGETLIGGSSPSLLSFAWSVPKSLEAALFHGRDTSDRTIGPASAKDPASYAELHDAFFAQVDFSAKLAAKVHARNNKILGRECAFLLGSLLTEDCLARGKSMLTGGARHIGSCVMSQGMSNAADALVAIKQQVFEEKSLTLDALRFALKDDFKADPGIGRRLKECAKFGNDNQEADSLYRDLWREISRVFDRAGTAAGLDFLTVSSVNPGGYFMGQQCGATADGRKAQMPFAIGNSPTAGNDTHGLTALLNSLSTVDPANGGATTNIKLSKDMFTKNLPKLKSLFSAFWSTGGMQATISVVNQADLLDALDNPAKYPHLLVRVGGWTMRFIDLERDVQQDIIRRTVHGAAL